MNNLNSFLQNLDSHHENFKVGNVNINSLNDNIEFYESFIPDFFSKNGEADGIKSVYKVIKESLDNEKTIICSDILQSSNIYKEYMDGMVAFIHDIYDITITESCDMLKPFEEKFKKAKEKDSIFIESLYNGKLNEKKEMPLSEAVLNLEFLIDFIPQISDMKRYCYSLNESFKDETEEQKKSLIENSLSMLYESVDNYCYSTIKNIITTYSDIQEKLFNESVEDDSNENNDTFKLF